MFGRLQGRPAGGVNKSVFEQDSCVTAAKLIERFFRIAQPVRKSSLRTCGRWLGGRRGAARRLNGAGGRNHSRGLACHSAAGRALTGRTLRRTGCWHGGGSALRFSPGGNFVAFQPKPDRADKAEN